MPLKSYYKKGLKLIFIGLLIVIVFVVIQLFYNMYFYGYHKSKDVVRNYKSEFFADSINNALSIETALWNRQGDSVFIMNYGKDIRIVLLDIKQYKNIPIQSLIDKKLVKLVQEDAVNYTDYIYNDASPIEIDVKMKLINKIGLSVCFNTNSEINEIKRGENYLYYNLSCDGVAFSSNSKFYEIAIRKGTFSESNVLIYSAKGKFYIALLYPSNSSSLKTDMLLKMFRMKH